MGGASTTEGGHGFGGGIYASGTPVTLACCTISGNNSTGQNGQETGGNGSGGGIYGSPTLANTIVAGNTAVGGSGGGIYPGSGTGPDVSGAVTSGGWNLIRRTDGADGSTWQSTDLLGGTMDGTELDPGLAQLQDNGGPGPTMLLMSGGPAIDHGNSCNIPKDELGQARPFPCYNLVDDANVNGGDRSDIGAVEYYPPPSAIAIAIRKHGGGPVLTYPSNSPGTLPSLVPQSIATLGGSWSSIVSDLNPVRTVSNGFLVADHTGLASAFYRLTGPVKNPPVTPMPATQMPTRADMTLVYDNGCPTCAPTVTVTLSGTAAPAGPNPQYWFQCDQYVPPALRTTALVPPYSVTPISLSQPMPGLIPYADYYCQLVYYDDDVDAQYGGILHFLTTGSPPKIVTGGATPASSTSEVMSLTVNNTNCPLATPTHAKFQYNQDPNLAGTVYDAGSYYTTTINSDENYSYTLSGLTVGNTYYYRAFASNLGGNNVGQILHFTATAPLSPPALGGPGNGNAPGPTIGTLNPTFTWTAASGASTYGLSLTLYPDGTPVYSSTTLPGTPTSAQPVTLQPGTQYAWTMTSFDSSGQQSAPSQPFYFVTGVAPTVQNLAANNVTGSSALLQADVNPNGWTTTVYFQYGLDTTYSGACSGQTVSQNNITTSQTVILGASPLCKRKTYLFQAVAYNSIGTNIVGPVQFNTP